MRRTLAVLGVGVVLVVAGCGGGDDNGSSSSGEATATATATATQSGGGTGGTQQASAGKDLFKRTCAGCHTLKDAGANGQVGPNLDNLKPDKDEVARQIETGGGQMPANLLQGKDRDEVAAYVASVAGKG